MPFREFLSIDDQLSLLLASLKPGFDNAQGCDKAPPQQGTPTSDGDTSSAGSETKPAPSVGLGEPG